MNDFLSKLALRSLRPEAALKPLPASRFEPVAPVANPPEGDVPAVSAGLEVETEVHATPSRPPVRSQPGRATPPSAPRMSDTQLAFVREIAPVRQVVSRLTGDEPLPMALPHIAPAPAVSMPPMELPRAPAAPSQLEPDILSSTSRNDFISRAEFAGLLRRLAKLDVPLIDRSPLLRADEPEPTPNLQEAFVRPTADGVNQRVQPLQPIPIHAALLPQPAMEAVPFLQRQETVAPEPLIQVSIGRIEVRALASTASPRHSASPGPRLSLDDYLRQRG